MTKKQTLDAILDEIYKMMAEAEEEELSTDKPALFNYYDGKHAAFQSAYRIIRKYRAND